MIRRLLVIGALLIASIGCASAQGLTTITVLDSASATKTYRVVQDSSNRFSSTTALCDPTTGALAAANCVTVSSGAALVTGTGGTFPATQSGTWNITNVSGTVSLPTGASTAAKQPALGTAGSASTDVISVQGIASMTPLFGIVRDAAGNARGANVNASNQLSVSVDGGTVFNANGIAAASASSPMVQAYDQVNSTTGNIAANNTTAVVVNAAATTLYGVQVFGIGSAPAYLKLYNATSATCGSGTPVKRIMIPAAATAANGAGAVIPFPGGLRFSTGLTYCITTGIGDTDTTAPAASTFLANLDWR